VIAGAALARQGVAILSSGPSILFPLPAAVLVLAALLLTVGLWTPIAGTVAGLMQLENGHPDMGDVWFHILLATLCVALALLGP
jgi:hypothetical protein